MSVINSIKGKIIKDYSVKYKEKLENGLWFYVLLRYTPTSNSNPFHRGSSEIYIDAIITDGNQNTYSNGTLYYKEIEIYENISKSENFKELEKDLTTKDGFRVWQEEYNKKEYSATKSRNLKWLIEVPKEELIKIIWNTI